jgi:FAD/FMN-containing dehydrogenase
MPETRCATDGLVIDLSQMKAVNVDRAAKTVRVGPGARWAAVDREAQAFGLATTGGTVSTVGVAGFILGGGSGHLARKYGLGLDNLVAAEVVTAAGDVLRASATENTDLFWGLRGGSGNLGIVTSLELRLHELGTDVLAGQIIYPFDQARDVLRNYRSFTRDAPDEIQCYAFFLRLPPLPVFPEEAHGKVVVDLVVTYAGDMTEGERHLAPLRALGRPMMDTVAPTPYVALQQAFDAGMAGGNRWYSKAHYLRELSDDAIETIVVGVEALPGDFTMVYLEAEGGAIGRVDPAATAFPHRDAPYALHIFPGWTRAADDEAIMAWARSSTARWSPHATGGVYVNLLGGDEADGARAAYGSNYDRLAELKRRLDPENLLRHNHNVPPRGDG